VKENRLYDVRRLYQRPKPLIVYILGEAQTAPNIGTTFRNNY
jgi:hypothetical protein